MTDRDRAHKSELIHELREYGCHCTKGKVFEINFKDNEWVREPHQYICTRHKELKNYE